MSVQEIHRVHFGDDGSFGVVVARRLAAFTGATFRWGAVWPAGDGPGSPRRCRTLEEVAAFVRANPEGRLVLHWRPAMYVGDDGPSGTWLSFVDPWGQVREDARVYGIELTRDAVPFSAGSEVDEETFAWGPSAASGFALALTAIRDHMPLDELRRQLAAAVRLPVDAIGPVPGG